jgi:predicted XRE-type DNA-binding protein
MSKASDTKSAYAELGFPDAAEMLVKAQLVMKIAKILRNRGWSQQHAAKIMGLTQPKLSKMLRGQFRGTSEAKLMDCLIRLGCDVKIVVGPERKTATSRVKVVAA